MGIERKYLKFVMKVGGVEFDTTPTMSDISQCDFGSIAQTLSINTVIISLTIPFLLTDNIHTNKINDLARTVFLDCRFASCQNCWKLPAMFAWNRLTAHPIFADFRFNNASNMITGSFQKYMDNFQSFDTSTVPIHAVVKFWWEFKNDLIFLLKILTVMTGPKKRRARMS